MTSRTVHCKVATAHTLEANGVRACGKHFPGLPSFVIRAAKQTGLFGLLSMSSTGAKFKFTPSEASR
jgi:hypothetical protein